MAVALLILLAILLLLVLGWVVVGLAFKLLWWVLVGLVIGALARLILPGRQALGLLATAGAGIVGALVGGILADALDVGGILQFLLAVVVAATLVYVLERRGGVAGA
ncbi:MAG: GlsB/YeaQ/YmgE family stress response membrane protein [Pseudomonadota bacterium]